MPQVKGTQHARFCASCNQKKPHLGFRGNICKECCLADLARFSQGRLVNALHLLLGMVPRRVVSQVCDVLSGEDTIKGGNDGAD